ncbi:lysine-2,3-aminomutase-like protein [Prosthecodimorpha staleyi]|uniref:Lysine-2,3-aminomutase-like protein n=1 Tax=Prosthecodimorpha staleyi TaxID=2840188 RepID=A0A947GD81_9HYPH|nr:lysine-2,3-aminomutase-like protein [Prosthecodimorpha staleyi]MBT9292248.1 lysine-2,3-aminomutase-like protein [Prosthecodimorpha staleyi]
MTREVQQRPPAVVRVADLVARGLVAPEAAPAVERVTQEFSLRITAEMAAAIDPADPSDPIARQFVPGTAELDIAPDEVADPIGDGAHEIAPGLIRRYPDRALLKPTHLCQVYCRFCFRRETVGGDPGLGEAELAAALDRIRAEAGLFEVILSGGDPLVLSDRRIGRILDALDAIDHVGVVRFHTRIPIVDPARITPALLNLLDRRAAIWFVLHVNHASELTENAKKSIRALSRAGVPLLAQTVLLKGINDDAAILEDLFRSLVALRVKPYYLHHLDRARGTGHFRTSLAEGRSLMRTLRGRLTGIAQPTYMLDIPGGYGKVPVGPDYVASAGPGLYRVTDPHGATHDYRDGSDGVPD